MVLRSVRAGQGDDPQLQGYQGRRRRSLGEPSHRRAQARAAVLELPSRRRAGTAMPATSTAMRWSIPNKLALLTPGIDRKTGEYLRLRRAGDGGRQLSARAARRAGEVRPEQHALPDDAGGGREQAQHADRQAGQVQEPVGSRRAAARGPADRLRGATASATPATRSARSATRCTISTARRTSRSCSG